MPKIHHPVRLAKAFCSTKTFSRCALYAWNLEPQALCYEMQVDAPGRWGLHTYISFHAHHLCIHFLPCSCTFAFMSCPLILLTFCGIHLLHGPFIFARISLRFGFCTHFLPFQSHWLFSFPGFSFIAFEGKAHRKTKSGWNQSQCPLQKCTVISFFSHWVDSFPFVFLRQLLHSCPFHVPVIFLFLWFLWFFCIPSCLWWKRSPTALQNQDGTGVYYKIYFRLLSFHFRIPSCHSICFL